MKKFASSLIVACALFVTFASVHAEAGLRSFYWTFESQSYSYDREEARYECFAHAEAAAYPYAYNTCVAKIGAYACEYSTTSTQYLRFSGRPGLYECQVRVWVQAYE